MEKINILSVNRAASSTALSRATSAKKEDSAMHDPYGDPKDAVDDEIDDMFNNSRRSIKSGSRR